MKKNLLLVGGAVAIIAIVLVTYLRTPQPTSKSNLTVKIGAVLPLTGPTGYLGEGESTGIRLALEEETDVSRTKVEFVFEDSQGKADLAVSAIRKLLDIQDIRIQTVFTTTPVLATLPLFRDSGKDVLVIAQCMIPKVTEGFSFAYRLYATSDEETDLLALHAKRNNMKRFAGLHINNRFGEEGVTFFERKIREFGGTVELKEQFAFDVKDFRTVLQKIKRLKVDGLIIYAYSTSFPIIFQQMVEIGLDIPVLGNLDLALGGLKDKVPQTFLRRVVFPAPRYYFDGENPRVRAFNENLVKRGKEPNVDIAYAYDMAKILIAAVQKAASPEPSKVEKALRELMPFEGVTGTIRLDDLRDTRADMRLVRWGSQGIETVSDSLQN